jgi:hypothetical protein
LRHANQLINTLESKISQDNKFNILVLNLNVIKTACLLIEMLELMANKFYQLKVRCGTLRGKIEELTKQYMQKVDTELEMRYLLLDKDFDHRDALDLITSHKIFPLLESKFADNVVKEIWRSPYSTNNSLFSASTNNHLTFQYWNCVQDEETMNRFYHEKDIKQFEAHPLQFTVWRYSGKSRIIVEFVSTIILAITVHILVNYVIRDSPNIDAIMTKFLDLEAKYRAANTTDVGYKALEDSYKQAELDIKQPV